MTLKSAEEKDGVVYLPRKRHPSASRRKTRIDTKTRNWVRQHIRKKEELTEGSYGGTPTDAFGEIDFKGATRKAKAKFIRFSDTTTPTQIFNLLTNHWNLEKPRLLISVTGGAKSFNLDPKLKQIFEAGLLKVAQTPGAWVITGGTNTGVMQYVGEALQGITKACIGICSWGIVTDREDLLCYEDEENLGGKFPYHVSCSLVAKGAYLDHNHTHHLLVDDGTDGKYGGEISFRSQFEKYIMESTVGKVPAVLLVLQGGIGTLETICAAISDDSSISIVVVKGSGRAADIIAFAVSAIKDPIEYNISDTCMHAGLHEVIRKAFPDLEDDVQEMYCQKVYSCMKKRESFTVFQMGGEMGIDEAILMALLRGQEQQTSPFKQLQLTLLWDRADLAQEKILSQTYQWKIAELEFSMVMALAMDRVDFVKLFLEYGVSIASLLTHDMLEFLYGYQSQSCTSTLKFEFDEKEYISANLYKYGEVVNFLCSYEGFNPRKCAIPRRIIHQILSELCKNLMVQGSRTLIENLDQEFDYEDDSGFLFPYRELFFWAVLNNKHKMAMYLWEFEEEAMAKALIAGEINHTLFEHSQKIDLPDDIVKSFSSNSRDFKDLASKLLDECYRANESKTQTLITTEFSQFPRQTCVSIAVNTRDLDYVSHSSVQALLNDVWTGQIKTREVTDLKLMLAFIFPPLIDSLAFDPEPGFEDDETENTGIEERNENGHAAEFRCEHRLVQNDYKHKSYDSLYKEKRRSDVQVMSYYKKFYNFYFDTPVIKFYAGVISYFGFLLLFAYVSLVRKDDTVPAIPEIILIVHVVALTVAELHQISQGHGHSLKVKLREWSQSQWNIVDAVAIILFFAALALRMHPGTVHIGHLMYALDGGFWVVRVLKVFFVHRVLGPYVVMIYRMTKDTLYFLVILFVFLVSYGVSSKAVLMPQQEGPRLDKMFKNILFHPYFNIFGEFFIDRDPIDNKTTRFGTPFINDYSEPVAWLLLAVYLFITNVLLLNLLIAIFNNTFNSVQENAEQIWKFERYGLVVEYAQRAPIVAPLSLFAHLFLIIRYLLRTCGICKSEADQCWGLKSNIAPEEKEDLVEFENNCLAVLVRKREALSDKTIEEASVEIIAQLESVKVVLNGFEERFNEIEENYSKKLK